MSDTPITHLCFDLETTGVKPKAGVLSLAVVPFQFERKQTFMELVEAGFYVKLDLKDQVRNYGRTMEDGTMSWWADQSAEARAVLKPKPTDVPIARALPVLRKWIEKSDYHPKKSWIWSRGNLFDFGKIESLYQDIGENEPYNGFMQRDIRTMIDCLTGSTNGKTKPLGSREGFIPHNALHDAANDALTMIEIYNALMEE